MNNQWRDNADCMVVWADGSYDSKRSCDECGLDNCKNVIHTDRYKEIGHTALDTSEADISALSYWDYMHSEQPLGGKFDFDGELVVKEFFSANPDGLAETPARGSGITEAQHQLVQEAYETFTEKQKQVWQMVMREQLSETEAARRLNVSKQTVNEHLSYAKAKFAAHLRGETC